MIGVVLPHVQRKYYRTVRGDVPAEEVGHAQTHEHLLIDLSGTSVPQGSVKPEAEEIRLDNYYETRRHHSAYSIVMDSIDDASQEIREFKEHGGELVVEPTSNGLKRNPEGLRDVSERSGVHVVMGSGHYYRDYHSPELDHRTSGQIAEGIIHDIMVGAGEAQIPAGIVGEIGLSWPVHPREKVVLEGAAIAQRETGAALMIHPGRNVSSPLDAMELARKYGADPERVIMCHIDRTLFNLESMLELAATGCYLEFDLFGQESSYYPYGDIDMPNDAIRVNYLVNLVEHGFKEKLLIAQDICKKVYLRKYGGEGYGHILRNILPLMKRKGMSDKLIDQIRIENPRQAVGIPE